MRAWRPAPFLAGKKFPLGKSLLQFLKGNQLFRTSSCHDQESRCLSDSLTTSSAEDSGESLVRTAFTALWASACL